MLLCRACADIDDRISGAVPALAAGTLTSVHTLPSGLRDVLRNAGRACATLRCPMVGLTCFGEWEEWEILRCPSRARPYQCQRVGAAQFQALLTLVFVTAADSLCVMPLQHQPASQLIHHQQALLGEGRHCRRNFSQPRTKNEICFQCFIACAICETELVHVGFDGNAMNGGKSQFDNNAIADRG